MAHRRGYLRHEGPVPAPAAATLLSNLRNTLPHVVAASYWTLEVDGATNPDAAWFYPEPKDAAAHVRGRVAFWRGVRVEA